MMAACKPDLEIHLMVILLLNISFSVLLGRNALNALCRERVGPVIPQRTPGQEQRC